MVLLFSLFRFPFLKTVFLKINWKIVLVINLVQYGENVYKHWNVYNQWVKAMFCSPICLVTFIIINWWMNFLHHNLILKNQGLHLLLSCQVVDIRKTIFDNLGTLLTFMFLPVSHFCTFSVAFSLSYGLGSLKLLKMI